MKLMIHFRHYIKPLFQSAKTVKNRYQSLEPLDNSDNSKIIWTPLNISVNKNYILETMRKTSPVKGNL